jgi:aminoglycoside phosphotransferase (APT) family kinase protein
MMAASGQDLQTLINKFCALFTRLHNLDWRQFVTRGEVISYSNPHYFFDRWLRNLQDIQGDHQLNWLPPLLEWSANQRDDLTYQNICPTHNDYHPNNILLKDNGEMVVIDWTGFAISDPRFDLAWSLMLANSYRDFQSRTIILDDYQNQIGSTVEKIEVFEALASIRRMVDVYISLTKGAERQGMRPAAVEAIREQIPAHMRVLARLTALSSYHVGEVQSLLDSLV